MNPPTPLFADLVTSQKYITGEWYVIPAEGKIYNKYHCEIVGSIIKGYAYVGTTYYGEKVNIALHRAVWICAHGGAIPDPALQIDHINGIKTDNRIENLRICTAKENSNNPNAPSAHWGADNPQSKISDEQRREIYRKWMIGQLLPHGDPDRVTVRKLAQEYGITHQRICRILQIMRSQEAAQ